jgi:predicted TIM-barrel fold metal-dependent hydrolase
MVSAASLPNCWLDVSAMPDFFDKEGWPYPSALELLRLAAASVGPEKLLWGSDIPSTLCRATYPQMIEMFRRAGLREAELDMLFYTNALAAYGLPVKEGNDK